MSCQQGVPPSPPRVLVTAPMAGGPGHTSTEAYQAQESGANPGVFTKDGDPSWNLRLPLSFTLSCVFYKLPSPACLIGSGRDHSQPCASHEPGRHSLCSQQSGHLWNSCPRPAPRQRGGCKANPHQQPCSCQCCSGHHSHLSLQPGAGTAATHATW